MTESPLALSLLVEEHKRVHYLQHYSVMTMTIISCIRPLAQVPPLRKGASLSLKAVAVSFVSYHDSASFHSYSTSVFHHVGDGRSAFRSTAVRLRNFRPTDAPLQAASGLDETSDLKGQTHQQEQEAKTPHGFSLQAGLSALKWHVPQRVREKVISAEDAVALVQDGDTVAVSGFVCQGAPEGLLKALGERFQATNEPKNLTLLFGGGPGDYGERGLSHLAKVSDDGQTQMLKRTIGG